MMTEEDVTTLIGRVKNAAFCADNRCRYDAEWIDSGQFIVNCYVTDKCAPYLAEDRARRLADVVCEILNQYYPVAISIGSWVRYSEPNYWQGSEEVDSLDELKRDGSSCVQFCIFEEGVEF